jgi:thioester reductase-like protein
VTAPILVTGATGFVGREVVRRLLAAGRSVIALVRDRDGEAAEDRLSRAVGPPARENRLRVARGDLAAAGLGLADSERRRLRAAVETVIHCAGDPTFAPADPVAFAAGHVEGPLALLEALPAGRLRRWAHVSTAFVCGRRSGVVRESEGDVGQEFHNEYERVKLRAESAVRAATSGLGVDLRVVRPSIVVGPAPGTAGGGPSNAFFDFIRMAAALARLPGGDRLPLRIQGRPHARFNLVPLPYVTAAIVALAEHPAAGSGTFHVVVRDAPTQAAILTMITRRLGLAGLTVIDALDEPLEAPSSLERLVARMLERYHAYLRLDVEFDDRDARRLLDACGIAAPRLSGDVVGGLIDQALATATPRGAVPAAAPA